jgi:hypothetical protein
MTKTFDVFLSHNSKDKPAVRELAETLRARGLNVWLDEWELVPGQPWQEALEEIIETTRSSAVLVGKDGLGPWHAAEMRGCLTEFVRRKLPVIPVLLPGAPSEPRLPLFLTQVTWVDLRSGLTEEGLDQLQWGITGTKLDRLKLKSIPTGVPELSVAAAEAQPASAEVRPVPPEAEAPATAAEKQPSQKTRALWGVPAWIGLLTLLGIAVFLFARFPRHGGPQTQPAPSPAVQKEVGNKPGAPRTGEPTSRNTVPGPAVPAVLQKHSGSHVPVKPKVLIAQVFTNGVNAPGSITVGSPTVGVPESPDRMQPVNENPTQPLLKPLGQSGQPSCSTKKDGFDASDKISRASGSVGSHGFYDSAFRSTITTSYSFYKKCFHCGVKGVAFGISATIWGDKEATRGLYVLDMSEVRDEWFSFEAEPGGRVSLKHYQGGPDPVILWAGTHLLQEKSRLTLEAKDGNLIASVDGAEIGKASYDVKLVPDIPLGAGFFVAAGARVPATAWFDDYEFKACHPDIVP